jgi:hypothetical protein
MNHAAWPTAHAAKGISLVSVPHCIRRAKHQRAQINGMNALAEYAGGILYDSPETRPYNQDGH